MKKNYTNWSGCLLLLTGLSGAACAVPSEETRVIEQGQNVSIDARRSLAVTDQTILERFPLERVLDELIAQSGVAGLSSAELFQQFWDTQNPGPGISAGPHCDDVYDPVRGTLLNDFPYVCRPAPSEGAQASCDPFAAGSPCAYVPIGLFNRFDMAPEDGAHCGEYRIIYAKESGLSINNDRNLIIFEAVMPNPLPQLGLKGCQNVVKLWGDLSSTANIEKRADDLEDFYFDGTGLIPPAIHVDHLGAGPLGLGQIRTNQFMFARTADGGTGWMLREFKLAGTQNTLLVVPATAKVNPAAELFDPNSTHTQAAGFRADFLLRVPSLLASDVGSIALAVPDQFNSGQSAASGPFASETDYVAALGAGVSDLRTALEAEVAGTSVSVDQLLERARTQTCAGCHRRSRGVDLGGGLSWPADLGFVHVSEQETEVAGGEVRFQISEALSDVFLPARRQIMEDFLNNKPRPPAAEPTMPLSGHRHHG